MSVQFCMLVSVDALALSSRGLSPGSSAQRILAVKEVVQQWPTEAC